MAKFVAKQPTNNVALGGIAVLANPQNLRFDDIDSKGFIAESTSLRLEISGYGFKKAFGRPKPEGTVTDIKYYSQGTLIYKLKDAKYPFHDLAESSNAAQHTQKIFKKNDTIKGSFGTDTLHGYKGNDKIDGKGASDYLYGDGGDDILIGGEGSDYLDGGKGKDTYVFKADPITGLDTITKYQKNEQIHLKAKYFPGLVAGELLPEQFVVGSSAQDADDRIIYNPNNGYLYHDADGLGGVNAVAFAKLQTGVSHLGAEDFLIF